MSDESAAFDEARRNVTEKDYRKVVENSDVILEKGGTGKLAEYFQDIKDMVSLVKDYLCGEYPEVPYGTLIAIVAALIYVLSPIDLIPDFIPVVGLADDAIVVGLCLEIARTDLENYRKWKSGQ